MKQKIKNILKSIKIIYSLYYVLGSIFLKIMGKFIKIDEKMILFVVYGGKRYDDSPRFVYEAMKKDKRFQDFKFVWAFEKPDEFKQIPNNEKIKIDTLEYFKKAIKAKYWFTNSSCLRGLNFQKKENLNFLFQHGMAGIKKLGNDLKNFNKSFRLTTNIPSYAIIIEGKKEEEILRKAWNYNGEFWNIGIPRNDDLLSRSELDIINLKEKLGIPLNKKVILYAPTFREYQRDSKYTTYLKPPFNFDKWKKELGNEYVFLITAHYEVEKLINVPKDNNFIINAFGYPYINDLMIVSDLLISDYSSIIWDYSILGRPILSYAYDYDVYVKERGLYEGYENIFMDGIQRTEEELINTIKKIDYITESEYTKKNIRDKFITDYGNIAEKFNNLFYKKVVKNE